MKKRILSLFLCAVMCVGLLPQTAFAVEGGTGNGGSISESTTDIDTIFGAGNATLENGTITLNNNVTVSSPVEFTGGEWTLDLGGFTLSGADGAGTTVVGKDGEDAVGSVLVRGGTLTITGNGTIRGGNGGNGGNGGPEGLDPSQGSGVEA